MKSDDWFRDDIYRPAEESPSAERETQIAVRRTARAVRLILLSVVTLTALLMLYWLVQTFICDFREALFPGMPRRESWLCR
jgi:preprotein translocase subunit SecF